MTALGGLRTARHSVLVLTFAAIAWLLAAGPAAGHAMLVDTDPADGTALDTAPDTVVLRFNEAVRVPDDAVRVFDGDANRVDDGPVDREDPAEVAVGLPAVPAGGYVVTWRVISADSHPVAGTFTFTVGDAEAVSDEAVRDLFGGAGQAWTGGVGPVLRATAYAGVLLALGAVAFAAWVATGTVDRRAAWTWSVRGAVAGAAASLLAVPVQAVAVTGRTLGGVLASPTVLGDTLVFTSFGQSTLLRLVGLAALMVAWRRIADHDSGGTAHYLEPLVAGAIATGSFVLDGHQRTVEPVWLLASADLVHVLGAALWFGGLILLCTTIRRRALDDDPIGAARLVARFSRLALWSVVALTVAGLLMSGVLVRAPRALTVTGYGWTLLAKTAAVGVVLVMAAYNRWRLEPAVAARLAPAGAATDVHPVEDRTARRSRRAWSQLRITALVEVVGLVLVVGLTGFLVSQRPAAEAAGITGAYQATVPLTEEYDVDLVVDPNRAGRNALHVYVLDATGRPVADVSDLRLELTYVPEQIGPIEISPFLVGPGHWTANIDDLRFAGEWEARVVAGIDRFTEAETRLTFVVNR